MNTAPEKIMTREKVSLSPLDNPLTGEEVVISGISGIFPKSDNVYQFMENLYNEVDMVSSYNPRWVFNHPEASKHLGIVNGMEKFDAQFFRVHYKQAIIMEPMSRKLLEHTYSAIYDSGINPLQLRGKKIGVFIGASISESEKIILYDNLQGNGLGITGSSKAMYANRISYWIDGKGPSYSLDLDCASSSACFEHAYRSIRSGNCDAAIVGGCNLCMHPNISLHCRRAGYECMDGKTKCFDKRGDGHARADTISVLFLQRAKDAKRIYAEVYHAKTVYSPSSEVLLPVRKPEELEQFFNEFYMEADVSPEDVEYIEGNGSANPEADANELEAVGKVFGKQKPIKIGCVKSNMGSSEAASGVCGLIKMCLTYHTGKLPGNLHYENPINLPEVYENKVQVLTKNTKFGRGFTAFNSFSYNGTTTHVLLKGHYKQKDPERYVTSIPRLVLISGRQDECVSKFIDNLKKQPIDPEQIGLLHSIHEFDIPGHTSRGYVVLDTNEQKQTVCLSQGTEYYSGTTLPIWFVYSGMGSQWATMGVELMRLPIFSAAIQKCHNVLEPKGIDIVKILCDPDKSIYDNILHSFLGIAAVQIGLTDILKAMGIVPDNIIGHSVGELGCAYADGCFTAEEMILSAYSRGLVSVQTSFIRGSMAAIGLGYKEIVSLCPPEIEVACHNSFESSTISGPADVMKRFVEELKSQGIFAKEVPCSNIAYHSKYIANAGPGLLKYLSAVIKTPKARSKKWVSTSIPREKWNEPMAQYSSAEYHTNNLLSSVLFEETSSLIPRNALVIEVAPHGLLQAILKRSFPECIHVPLTRRNNADPLTFLLEAIGKLYQAGLNPKINLLYPKIDYPVSSETPILSQNIEWEHSEDWPLAVYSKERKIATIRNFIMSIHDDEFEYFKGNVRDGQYIFPESAYIVLVWETLAMYKGMNYKEMPVIFKDVQFHAEAIIEPNLPLILEIMIFKGNDKFEITYKNSTIVSGIVQKLRNVNKGHSDKQQDESNSESTNLQLNVKDIYTIMKLRGYDYKKEFQSIHLSNFRRSKALIKWTSNWTILLDSIIQFNTLAQEYPGITIPKLINKICIDTIKHIGEEKVVVDGVTCIDANLYKSYQHTRCGGIEVDGICFENKANVEEMPDVLMNRKFMPHFINDVVDVNTALQIILQLVSENITKKNINVTKLITSKMNSIYESFSEQTYNITTHSFHIQSVQLKYSEEIKTQLLVNTDVLIVDNLLGDRQIINSIIDAVPKESFILTLEDESTKIDRPHKLFNIISTIRIPNTIIVLLRKVDNTQDNQVTYLPIVQDINFSWIAKLQTELAKSKKFILVSEKQPSCGLIGLVKNIRNKFGNDIGLVVVDDHQAPSFNPTNDVFKDQLQKHLAFNNLTKGQWGGYYNITHYGTAKPNSVILTSTITGDLDSLTWVEKKSSMADSYIKVQVCYTGPSLKDAQNAAKKSGTPTDNTANVYGMDFSGVTDSGERVMGLVSGGSIASTVDADPDMLWPVPKHWSLEEAATVPLPFVNAYYCLKIKCSIHKGMSVFVNGGAGALGQAVIAICFALDCEVYTTVSDINKKELLLRMFPKLKPENVTQSREIMFQDMVRSNSKNKCCDIIVNCLSGPLRKAAMKCTGFNGVFLDISEYDMARNEDFEMNFLTKSRSYISVNTKNLFKLEYAGDRKMILLMMAEGIARGIVRPLSRLVYPLSDATRAFRLLSSGKNTGRVLIKIKSTDSLSQMLAVTSRNTYSSNGSYVVICDGSALGIELADHIIKHGARNLIVHMRSNSIAGYCHSKFMEWKKMNVSLTVSSDKLQTEKDCYNLLKGGSKLIPILGVFIVQNFSQGKGSWEPEDFLAKFNNTARVVANLDLVSRNICNELEHFVVLNYAPNKAIDEYMGSVTDKICRARNDVGLPALVLRAGIVKELLDSEYLHSKLQPQPLSALFYALETSLKLKNDNVITFNLKRNIAFDFVEGVSRIIGVKNIEDLDDNLRLNGLLLNNAAIDELNTFILKTYQVSYPVETLLYMTIGNLKNIGKKLATGMKRTDRGLGAFITYVDEDECSAAEPMVSKITSYSSIEEEDELDPKATYLFLIPGFEGHHEIFTTVCERLKIPAMALQLVPEMKSDSVPQIAANIAKFLKNRFEVKTKFYLLGYSFGVNVALELAKLFEKEGHVGVVYCLDSSPDALRAQLDAYIGTLTDSQLQNNIIEHMFELMTGQESVELKKYLATECSWEEKIEICVAKLRGMVKYSHTYIRSIIQSAYKRIKLARDYEPDFQLDSELILIKGAPHPKLAPQTDDYNLSKYTRQPMKIFNIESDHSSVCKNYRISNLVNRILEPKLLEEFNKKNLCLTYLADPAKKW